MLDKDKIGARLGALRKSRGFSQALLSERLNVSPQAVSKWETGQSIPDLETLVALSWIYRVSINTLLGNDMPVEAVAGIERKYLLLEQLLQCPQCRSGLKLSVQSGRPAFCCPNGHAYGVVDGVVDFGTREIPGEQWSLSYRNYDAYLQEHRLPRNPNYDRGEDDAEILWEALEKQRPAILLDVACGTGQGIKRQLDRICWPTTILMADISHRILKWNSLYYTAEMQNPFVDIVYLACDGADLPLRDGTADCVFSYAGYESMQGKMADGLREAHRVLRGGGCSVYTKSVIAGHDNANSRKWMALLLSAADDAREAEWWKREVVDVEEWTAFCQSVGFTENRCVKIYDELPAPDTDRFPFKNEVAQWMAEYVFTSRKPEETPE